MSLRHYSAVLDDAYLFVICETASAMAQTLAPEVRSQFAQRLKTIRTQRGFDRARYFAKTLGIEENRYTRYERAEVEPSLTLIHKICATLRVSPNELLGFSEPRVGQYGAGLAEPSPEDMTGAHGGPDAAGKATNPTASLAWSLAAEAAAIRQEHHSKSKTTGDPLAELRETSVLFQSLQAEPFETVARIVNDDALREMDAKRKAALADLIQAFTESIGGAAALRRRR
jgi:transcriptional regulator with XRE-family HTH domain